MININTYITKFGKKTFEKMPFNDVDGLIFAELSMINFEYLLKKQKSMYLKDMVIENLKEVTFGSPDARANGIMLKRMMVSKRYQDVKVSHVKRIFSDEFANQFYAVTFILPDGTLYLSFRGTDITIVGWKEDFYITFMDRIPSQLEALEYTHEVLKALPGNFILGGHSKGGNLAIYSAFNMKEKYNDRLLEVISYDGPGFPNGIDQYPNTYNVIDKVRKYITHRDFIGLLYSNIDTYKIVYSTGVLLGGHDPFAWKIDEKKGDFIYKDKCLKKSLIFAKGTNMWIKSLSVEDKLLGIDALSSICGKANNIYDLLRLMLPNIARYNMVIKQYPPEERKRLNRMIRHFFGCQKKAKIAYNKKPVKK